jgi:hypothetical protein
MSSFSDFIDVDEQVLAPLFDSAVQQLTLASSSPDRRNVLERLCKAVVLMYITSSSSFLSDELKSVLLSFQENALGHTRAD